MMRINCSNNGDHAGSSDRVANIEMVTKMDDYELLEEIGSGGFGCSYIILHKLEKKRYVLKKIRLAKQNESFKRKAHHEMKLMEQLHNPYIVPFKDAWEEKDCYVCIVTGYCEGGDMSRFLKSLKGSYLPEEKLCHWLAQLLLAVDYLHSNRILHRDLKCTKIFLTKDGRIQLGDFGLSKYLNKEDFASTIVGTPSYMCPELLANLPYGYKSDIWSLGCCIFEMAAHQPPFKAPDMAGLMKKINHVSLSQIPLVYSSSLKQLIKSMLRKNPEHRPTAAELLRHQYLQPYVVQCNNPSLALLPVKPKDNCGNARGKSTSINRTGYENKSMCLKENRLSRQEIKGSMSRHSIAVEKEVTSCRSAKPTAKVDDDHVVSKSSPRNLLKNYLAKKTMQRAEGLESLLEICAGLFREARLEELAGVLKPFGDEVVSSRETAIWLTKSITKFSK